MDNNTEKGIKQNRGREAFYAIIAVAVFIIMAIGTTFAYFTATARSGDSSVGTRSTTLSLEYISYGAAWSNNDLIPALTPVSEYSVEYQNDTTLGNNLLNGEGEPGVSDKKNNTLCKDDYGNSVCSAYVFQVRNPANSPQTVNLNLITEINEFANLRAMAYEIEVEDIEKYESTENGNKANDPIFKTDVEDLTEGAIAVTDGNSQELYDRTPIYINRNGVKKTLLKYNTVVDEVPSKKPSINLEVSKESSIRLADDITVNGGTTRTFAIILYVLNLENEDQTAADADRAFTGRVEVSNGDGTSGVSGAISAAGTAQLQGAE